MSIALNLFKNRDINLVKIISRIYLNKKKKKIKKSVTTKWEQAKGLISIFVLLCQANSSHKQKISAYFSQTFKKFAWEETKYDEFQCINMYIFQAVNN